MLQFYSQAMGERIALENSLWMRWITTSWRFAISRRLMADLGLRQLRETGARFDRRLRHRLFLDRVTDAATHRSGQDRQVFVHEVLYAAYDSGIVGIITLAYSVRLEDIADGVENDAQLHFLQELNCDDLQASYLSRPLPALALYVYLGSMH